MSYWREQLPVCAFCGQLKASVTCRYAVLGPTCVLCAHVLQQADTLSFVPEGNMYTNEHVYWVMERTDNLFVISMLAEILAHMLPPIEKGFTK